MQLSSEIKLISGFFDPISASGLLERLLKEVNWDDRMKARKTACFGQTYDDSGIDYEEVPMHPLLLPLLARVQEELGFSPTNALLNYYEDGRSSMGFHSDATWNLAGGTGVAIVSLGAERNLTFRRKDDPATTVDLPLPHGSLFYMTQAVQADWLHAIKKTDSDGARISLTFRHILTPAEMAAR